MSRKPGCPDHSWTSAWLPLPFPDSRIPRLCLRLALAGEAPLWCASRAVSLPSPLCAVCGTAPVTQTGHTHVCKWFTLFIKRNATMNSCLFSSLRIHPLLQFATSLGLKTTVMIFLICKWTPLFGKIAANVLQPEEEVSFNYSLVFLKFSFR